MEILSKEKLVAFSGEHLYYEISMLYGVTDILLKGVENEYISNALLEAFIIHASIIIDFFYRPQVYPGDARAFHYIQDMNKWRESLPSYGRYFKVFHHRRNKEVVHLSYNRLEVKPEEKRWQARKIIKQIRKLVDLFLEQADPQFLHPKIYEMRTAK